MGKEKLPDSYVVDRRLKTYPTEVGSVKFKVDDIDLFKNEKASKLKTYYSQKFDEMKEEYLKLMDDIEINERLYKCKYNFEPVVGSEYYLYSDNGSEFLSIISPTEWKNKFEFVGAFRLGSDGRWTKKQ